jgi:hypothetical protein
MERDRGTGMASGLKIGAQPKTSGLSMLTVKIIIFPYFSSLPRYPKGTLGTLLCVIKRYERWLENSPLIHG